MGPGTPSPLHSSYSRNDNDDDDGDDDDRESGTSFLCSFYSCNDGDGELTVNVDLLHNHFLGFQENPLPLADFIWIAPQHDDGDDGADDYDRGVVVMMPMTTGKGGACCAQTLA